MRVVLDPGVGEAIEAHAAASADGLETGGVLLGHDQGAQLVVTVAGGPGPEADRQPTSFLRDLHHARDLGDVAYDADGSVWLGEWHTHPGGLLVPSPTDLATYAGLLGDSNLGFTRFLSLIVVACPIHGWDEIHIHSWVMAGAVATAVPVVLSDVVPPQAT